MQNTGDINTNMPIRMKIFMLWFAIKEGANGIHDTASYDQP